MAEQVWVHPRHITPAIPSRGRRETLSLGAGYAYQVPRRIPKVPDRHVTPFVAMSVKADRRAHSLCGLERTGHVIYADGEFKWSSQHLLAGAILARQGTAGWGSAS